MVTAHYEGALLRTRHSRSDPLIPTFSHAGRACPTCAPLMPKSGKPDFGKGEKERKRRAHLTNEAALVALASEELVIDRAAQDVAAEVRARREREVGNGRIRQAL